MTVHNENTQKPITDVHSRHFKLITANKPY
jgi:hypothetical protein